MSDEKNYVRSDQLFPMFGWTDANDMAMRQQLMDALKSGRVAARADNAILDRGTKKVDGRWQTAEKETLVDWEVEPAVWGNTGLNVSARRYFSKSSHAFLSVELTGLWFSAADIVSQLDWQEVTTAPAIPSTLEPVKRGGRKASPGWPIFAAALAEWIIYRNDEPEQIINMGPEGIMDAVQNILAERSTDDFPRSTYQPAVQELIDVIEQRQRRK
jgi:hypothetical protein